MTDAEPCKVVIEEDAGMLSERVIDVGDEHLEKLIDVYDGVLETCSEGSDESAVATIDKFDEAEGG